MKIMVLPGTVWQVPLMKRIKSLGYELVIANPVKNEGVFEIGDAFLESDIFDTERIISYCKENDVDIVMSEECDIAVDVVALINLKLGANCISTEIAELFTNKFLMREFCKEHNICPIPYALCERKEDVKHFLKESGSGIIMKPLDSNASHGVFTIWTESEVEKYFEESIRFSRHKKAVLVEKYIEGTEFTVDGIMTRQGHVTLAISEKTHYKYNNNIANSLLFTQHSTRYDYNLLRKTNDSLIDMTGLPFGITHVEYKYSNGTFFLIEMAARGGGNLISAIIVPYMSGVDNYGYLINSILDDNYEKKIIPDIENERVAILKFFDIPCAYGLVKEVQGEEYLKSEPCVKSYKLNFKVGDYIYQPENDSVRIGYYIVCAENRTLFNTVIQNIENSFKIIIE